jgi:hypothetical protein
VDFSLRDDAEEELQHNEHVLQRQADVAVGRLNDDRPHGGGHEALHPLGRLQQPRLEAVLVALGARVSATGLSVVDFIRRLLDLAVQVIEHGGHRLGVDRARPIHHIDQRQREPRLVQRLHEHQGVAESAPRTAGTRGHVNSLTVRLQWPSSVTTRSMPLGAAGGLSVGLVER